MSRVRSLSRSASSRALAALAMTMLLGACAHAPLSRGRRAAGDTVALRYTISRRADDTLALHVRLDLPPSRDVARTLVLPDEWAGRAQLYDNVIGLRALGTATLEDGAHPAQRVLYAPAGTPVSVEWTLRGAGPHAREARDAHNHSDLGARWAQLIGYDALVLPGISRGAPVRATFVFAGLPDGSAIATSFGIGAVPGDTTVVARAQLGDLQHAVYTVGLGRAVRAYDAKVPQGTLRVAVRGTLAGTRLTDAFVADIDSTRGMDERVLMLFAHELMHDWLGGALQAAPHVRDGALSWFTEGFTEYLSRRVLWRAGLLTDSVYVASVAGALREHALSPARDLPWDSVTAHYWTDPDAQRQPYLRGWLLALRLEALGRESRHSLDGVLRGMLTVDAGHPPALTDTALVRLLSPVAGVERTSAEVAAAVRGGAIEVPAELSFAGCVASTVVQRPRWEPGFDVDASLAARQVRGVHPGTAAARAGLRDGLPIRGASVYRGDASKPIEMRVVEDSTERRLSWLPASASTVGVQELTLRAGCAPPRD